MSLSVSLTIKQCKELSHPKDRAIIGALMNTIIYYIGIHKPDSL